MTPQYRLSLPRMAANAVGRLGHVRAIVFDWAGTTVDHGCMAPAEVFRDIFLQVGIEVTEAEARGPMGKAKVDHIRAMLAVPRIQSQWQVRFGRPSREEDVEDLYTTFLPLQQNILAHHSQVIPGVVEAIAWCRLQGMRIGSTTGYTRALMDIVEPLAEEQGYRPEVTVCSDEVAAGRPAPWQLYRAAEALNVYPMQHILVIDDSVAGIEAGLHAGCLTAAVTATGNALGMPLEVLAKLEPEERLQRVNTISEEFMAAGAHVVLESVAQLPELWRKD